MITVFLVDGTTRIFLPESEWGEFVVGKLTALGHTIAVSDDQTMHPDPRGEDELQRMRDLLDATDDPQ